MYQTWDKLLFLHWPVAAELRVCAEFMQKITGPTGEVSGNRFFHSFRTYDKSDSVFRA